MIFSLESQKDLFLENVYIQSMKELNEFFGINWIKNTPEIFTMKDRATINLLTNSNTENWLTGWADGNSIYLLDKENYESESCHEYSDESYSSFVKHELVHLFSGIFCGVRNFKPIWISEGLAVYLSGQNNLNKSPIKFEKFLSFYEKGGKEIYNESGFAIEILIKEFGKEKFFTLLKKLKDIETKKEFENYFTELYGFELDYENFNKFL
jgi:hypothetical protein